MGTAVVGVLVAAVVLSGCMGPADDEEGEDSQPAGPGPGPEGLSKEERAGAQPGWFPGLVYTYRVEHPATGSSASLDFVVLDGPGTDWTLDPVEETDEQREALAWALYWGFPVGAVDFQEYQPRLEGDSLDWFDFPLRDSQDWRGRAPDGGEVEFSAELVDVMLPDGREVKGYKVAGQRDGERVMEYTYTSDVGWFVSLWWDASGDGEPDVQVEYEGLRSDLNLAQRPLRTVERFVELEAETVASALLGGLGGLDGADPGEALVLKEFEVPAATMTYWLARFTGGAGVYDANVSFEEDGGLEMRWLHEGPEPGTHHAWGHGIPPAMTGEARLIVMAAGEAHLAGIQLTPLE